MSQPAILIVHSERWMPTLLGRAVQPLGVRVHGAANGTDGLALFHGHRCDIGLVLLGRTLPVVSSVRVIDEMQRYAPLLPVVIITGLPPFAVRHEYASYQLAGILQTPFDLGTISDLVQYTLNLSPVSAGGVEA